MEAIKSFTSLEQSRKLAEILPLESADMYWMHGKLDNVKQHPTPNIIGNDHDEPLWDNYDIPCWSLASLLSVLPLIDFTMPQLIGTPKTLYRCIYNDDLKSHAYNNPVDACVAMLEKLNELKML